MLTLNLEVKGLEKRTNGTLKKAPLHLVTLTDAEAVKTGWDFEAFPIPLFENITVKFTCRVYVEKDGKVLELLCCTNCFEYGSPVKGLFLKNAQRKFRRRFQADHPKAFVLTEEANLEDLKAHLHSTSPVFTLPATLLASF